MALSGNKGEWSEIYTLFKLLGDTRLYSGDGHLNKIPELYYPVLDILRMEESNNFTYSIQKSKNIVVISGGEDEIQISIDDFKKMATELFDKIKEGKGSFELPEVETFMASIYCKSLKAKSTDKSDIKIVIHDLRTNMTPTLGFSIKSEIGNKATLFNANRTTNFIYDINNVDLSDEQILEINALDSKSKIQDRINAILLLGGSLQFNSVVSDVLKNNLMLIDSDLPKIISEILKIHFVGRGSKLSDAVKILQAENPLNYDLSHNHLFYEYKIKHLLTDCTLGMVSATVWNGRYEVTGGYLIVKEDGDVLCYHVYNRNDFENYLLNNTKLETPSSTRHGFGCIEKIDGKQIFKLNLQIRFV